MRDDSRARALREANKLFKTPDTRSVTTDYERAQQSFHENRERLKAERLAREVKSPEPPARGGERLGAARTAGAPSGRGAKLNCSLTTPT